MGFKEVGIQRDEEDAFKNSRASLLTVECLPLLRRPQIVMLNSAALLLLYRSPGGLSHVTFEKVLTVCQVIKNIFNFQIFFRNSKSSDALI